MKKNKIARIALVTQLSIIVLAFIAIVPISVNAQVFQDNKYPLLEPLPCIPNAGQDCTKGELIKEINIEQYVNYVFNFSIAAAVLLAVIMIFVGGFEYVTSEIPGAKSNAKSRIQGAIGGLIMVLVSYLILYTLDPRLTNIKLGLPRIETTKYKISLSYLDSLSALGESSALTAAKRYEADAKRNESVDLRQKAAEIYKQYTNETDPAKREELYKNYEKTIGDAKVAAAQSVILDFESRSAEKLGALQSLIDNNAPLSDMKNEMAKLEDEYDKSIDKLRSQGLPDDGSLLKKGKFYTLAAEDAILAKTAMNLIEPSTSSFPVSSVLFGVVGGGAQIGTWLGSKIAQSGKELLSGTTNAESARKVALQLKYDETALIGLTQEDSQTIKNQREQMANKILAASPKPIKNEEAYIKQIKDTNLTYSNSKPK